VRNRPALAVLLAGVALAGCSAVPAAPAPAAPTSAPAVTTPARASATTDAPDLARRGAAADAYAATRGGMTGIVIRDRVTGATWANAAATRSFRAASTVKLAIAVDLLTRRRAGSIRLAARDLADLRAMLIRSDNGAASRLWDRFGGAAIGARFPAYGLTSATGTDRWGTVRCTPADLERLATYVLARTHPADRATLVDLLRAVDDDQRFGVLGVSAEYQPGAKNGWTPSGAGWAVASVGFAGPAERWSVAVMADLPGEFEPAVDTITTTAILLVMGTG
jgi:hypothetical protein